MRPLAHEVWRNVERGPGGGRSVPVRVYCTAPGCEHAVRTHPIHGSAYLGTYWEPPDAGPDACPTCDAPVDGEPLYDSVAEQREALEETP